MPTLVITVIAVAGVAASTEPVYRVSSSVILLVPNQPNQPDEGDTPRNPYLDLGGSLVTTARALADVLNGPATRADLAAQGHLAFYEVLETDRVPTLSISASSPDPDDALATVQAVIRRAGEELERLQDAVRAPPSQRIAPAVLVEPSEPVGASAHVTRALAAIAFLGLLAAFSLALLVENVAGRGSDRERPHNRPVWPEPADGRGEPGPRDAAGRAAVTSGRESTSDGALPPSRPDPSARPAR